MKINLRTFGILLFLLVGTSILRGIDRALPSADSLARVTAGKSAWEILGLANKYSYTDLDLALAYANIALVNARKLGKMEDVFNAQRAIGFIYEDNALSEKYLAAYEQAAQTAEI